MNAEQTSLRGMVYAALFGALTAVGAYIIIPLPPVPITLQTLFLGLAALLLGGRLGALSQTVYVLLGVIGLPVFAGGKAGLGVLLGPDGGLPDRLYHRRVRHRQALRPEGPSRFRLAVLFARRGDRGPLCLRHSPTRPGRPPHPLESR